MMLIRLQDIYREARPYDAVLFDRTLHILHERLAEASLMKYLRNVFRNVIKMLLIIFLLNNLNLLSSCLLVNCESLSVTS